MLSVYSGHSLGGGLAICSFLHLLSTRPDLKMSLNNGGVYTYGAPLVVHAFDQAKNSAACTHMQQQMDLSRCRVTNRFLFDCLWGPTC